MIEKIDRRKIRWCGYCGQTIDCYQDYFVNTHLNDCETTLVERHRNDNKGKADKES